jgi:glycosyltransferase involved in cell wall biosynthesis
VDRGHLLLVYYFFPPAVGGGVPRPVKMAKYLRRLGWEVTVLTIAAPGEVDVRLEVRPSAGVVRVTEWRMDWLLRILGGTVRAGRHIWERFGRLDEAHVSSLLNLGLVHEEQEIEASKVGWVVPGTRAAVALDLRRPIDVAVISSPPASSGSIGVLLRALRRVPYVVEYRDPWTVGPFWALDPDGQPRTDPITRARFAAARRLESILLHGASGVAIVNGESHVARLRTEFPILTAGKPVVHIPNGVDLEDASDLPAAPAREAQEPVLRLLHTGFFYHFHTPHHLIAALYMMHQDNPETLRGVEFEFVGGGFPEQLARQAERWGLGPHLRLTQAASFSESLQAVHGADGLIVVLPPIVSHDDQIPTKLYEYLSSTRPICAVVNPQGATAQLLSAVPDALVADNRDGRAIADTLMRFIALVRHRQATGYPPECAHRADAHHYQARAGQMDALLRGILKTSRH